LGLFFKDKEEESTKTMIIVRIIIALLMSILLVLTIINGFDSIFFNLMLILAGVGFVFDGVEKYVQKSKGYGFLFDFGFALLLYISVFSM